MYLSLSTQTSESMLIIQKVVSPETRAREQIAQESEEETEVPTTQTEVPTTQTVCWISTERKVTTPESTTIDQWWAIVLEGRTFYN